jgi:ABC-type transport system substrate-binding protein
MTPKLKFRSLLLATAVAVSSLAAPASWADTLRVAMGYDPVSLDPIATSDNGSIWTQLLIYDTLIRPDKSGTGLEPGVNGGVKLGHGAAQNWATLGLRETRLMGGGQSAALSI